MFTLFLGGKLVKIGEYNAMDNKLDLTRGTTIKWKGKVSAYSGINGKNIAVLWSHSKDCDGRPHFIF